MIFENKFNGEIIELVDSSNDIAIILKTKTGEIQTSVSYNQLKECIVKFLLQKTRNKIKELGERYVALASAKKTK